MTELANTSQVMQQAKSEFMNVSVDERVKWEKELRFAIQCLEKSSYLNKVAWSNKKSLQNAIVNVSAIGISLNPAQKHAYLVPRDGAVCLDISYMGLLHLACSTGSIVWGQAKIVRENDNYLSCGVDKPPEHNYNPFLSIDKRGPIVGAYCTVKTKDGDYLTEEMSIDDIYQIRNRSFAYLKKSGPWVTDEGQMIRKTVTKRASSYWPKVDRFESAVHILNENNGEGIDFKAEEKPEKIDKRTRRGRSPNKLPQELRDVFYQVKEAYEAEDFEVVKDIMYSLGEPEERIAVSKCFNSNDNIMGEIIDRQAEHERERNTEKQYILDDEALQRLVDYNWNKARDALPDAPKTVSD